MKASPICTQCLRALRQQPHPNVLRHTRVSSQASPGSRSVSTSITRLQESSRNQSSPPQHTQPPPFTTGTVTSNVTAAVPESDKAAQDAQPLPSASSSPNVSTSQMQKQISSSLSGSNRSSITMSLAKALRNTSKAATESYITYGVTEAFFKSCAAQAPYTIPEEQRTKILTEQGPPKTEEGEDIGQPEASTWWFDDLGLQPTFSTWSQVAYLHMYLLTARLRTVESASDFTNYQRYLIEHFSHAAEDKMVLLHSISARGIRNKYLKDLFIQWRGILAAYDEGLAKGDAVLGAAVWRNLWKGKEDVDWEKVAMIVAYMRKGLEQLNNIPLDDLVHNLDAGHRVWDSSRTGIQQLVARESAVSG